jgi:hypothetical protein
MTQREELDTLSAIRNTILFSTPLLRLQIKLSLEQGQVVITSEVSVNGICSDQVVAKN